MSAPSLEHEERVRSLETLADLAGCRRAVLLDQGLLPDLSRADITTLRLLVGDAKATEHARCPETLRRLRRYVRASVPWLSAGFSVRLAISHRRLTGAWSESLRNVVTDCGLLVIDKGVVNLDGTTAISWVEASRRE